jgi:hypothetical protein
MPSCPCRLASAAAFAAADEQRAAPVIEVGFGECRCFVEAETGSPEDHDESAQLSAVRGVAGGAHDGDDLLHLGRIGGVALTLSDDRFADEALASTRPNALSPLPQSGSATEVPFSSAPHYR